MYTSVTKGMPYATMVYSNIHSDDDVLPTIAAEMALAARPMVDGATPIDCRPVSSKTPHSFVVQREVELFFKQSDFTWLVFVSEPVRMQCVLDDQGLIRLQVVDWQDDADTDRNLIVRLALSKKCTSGVNPIYCHQEKLHPTALLLGQGNYAKQLRQHADFYPGPNTTFDYVFQDAKTSTMIFNWDVQKMSDSAFHPVPTNSTENVSLIGFALPHHFDIISQIPPTDTDIYCVSTLIGPACLYEGPVWELNEPIPEIAFRAARPPAPWAISSLAKSLQYDIHYTLPKFYVRGAGDTYFSGKMLAKLGRILLVAEEVNEICADSQEDAYVSACQNVTLPSVEDVSTAVDTLRSSLEIWINGTAETPFVFDGAWGGVVSCGCDFDGDKGTCRNKFPHCSGFGDPGLNFGVRCT
jgi:Glycosyl hydrolase family 81 C-terminal domain